MVSRVTALALFMGSFGLVQSAAPYCLAGDDCFPNDDALASFNETVNGALIKTLPYGAACYSASYDSEQCKELIGIKKDTYWRGALPAGVMYTNLELGEDNEGCPIPDAMTNGSLPEPLSQECTLGNQPSYVVNATTTDQVQAAVKFASEHNLRLRIKNSGHDYTGRSSGAGALSIWTRYMNDAVMAPGFVPDGCSSAEPHDAASVGTGLNVEELFQFGGDNGVVTIGGYTASVGAAGGYILGGGLGPLVPHFGMGVDNALQYEVVTADGEIKIANECTNTDLFWALRGGGGAFGVTTRLWIKTHPALAGINIVYGSIGCEDRAGYEELISNLVDSQESMRDDGHTGIWEFGASNLGGEIISMVAFFDNATIVDTSKSKAQVEAPIPETCKSSLESAQFLGPSSWNDAYTQAIWPMAEPTSLVGVNLHDHSRLVLEDQIHDQEALDDIKAMILGLPEDLYFIWQNNNGGVSNKVAGDATSVHPNWRRAFAFIDVPNFGPWSGPTEAQIAESETLAANLTSAFGSVTYYNEQTGFMGNWQEDSFGSNYPRLLEIKKTVDPNGVFSCPMCVGSEDGY